MPTPSAQLALPQIAGTDSPDIPRDVNALIAALEANARYLGTRDVLDVGMLGQTRAGRPFLPADFTNIGLSTPAAIWNLSDLTDSSGNARALTNKGAVPFGTGILAAASEAAVFAGATTQALYRADTGAADPFRIAAGSWGCWFRTAKRATEQALISKTGQAAGAFASRGWAIEVSGNSVAALISTDGTAWQGSITGQTEVTDDRWHFAVATYDGSKLRLYVDGALDGVFNIAGSIFASTGPVNIGAFAADASLAAITGAVHYGRADAAFVTADHLSDDQQRYLYASKIAHGGTKVPRRAGVVVRRHRRGSTLVSGDFPTAPVRGHNLANALTDFGSGGVALTLNAGTGAIVAAAGPDGLTGGAYTFTGAHLGLSSTDAGLPAALVARTYGLWVKTAVTGATAMGWGTLNTADARIVVGAAGTNLLSAYSSADVMSGPNILDGLWHHVVVVEDNAAADGVKRKLYLDGRCVAGSTVMNTLTLAGANRFRIGANPDGTTGIVGQAARAFVSAAALTAEQIRSLYMKRSQDLGWSPFDSGSVVERMDITNVYSVGEMFEPQDRVELEVAA